MIALVVNTVTLRLNQIFVPQNKLMAQPALDQPNAMVVFVVVVNALHPACSIIIALAISFAILLQVQKLARQKKPRDKNALLLTSVQVSSVTMVNALRAHLLFVLLLAMHCITTATP